MKILVYYSFYKLEIREGCKPSYNGYPSLWLITWDPTQPVATRPLAIQKDGTWFCYGWDLTKNICEVFGQNGYIRNTYAYTPFGNVTASGDVTQPIQWSSEYFNNELALVYYNYHHYNPTDGRWINRDLIAEHGGWNLYGFVGNKLMNYFDNIGTEIITYQFPREFRPEKYNSKAVTMIENAEEINKKLQVDYRINKNINKFCCVVSFVLETTFRIGLYWPDESEKISGYTSNGVATILAHENRRLSVYQKADIAYIKAPSEYYYKLYSESNSYEKAKYILDAYIQKIHHIAMDMF
ncbi:MAG: RHS repeat-associated core domain-containing protein [Akkermansia sp.]|nr:RHS repeat-associated core domain-containing protein [Akkermansia sp.]